MGRLGVSGCRLGVVWAPSWAPKTVQKSTQEPGQKFNSLSCARRMAPRPPKTAQDGQNTPHDGPKRPPRRPKMANLDPQGEQKRLKNSQQSDPKRQTQHHTTQNNVDKTRQQRQGQDKTEQDKRRQDKTQKQHKRRQDKTSEDKTRQDKTRHDTTTQDSTIQDNKRTTKPHPPLRRRGRCRPVSPLLMPAQSDPTANAGAPPPLTFPTLDLLDLKTLRP